MAAVGGSSPPPPPPGGPGKNPESGHKVSKVNVSIETIRDRFEGKSPQTARPTDEVIRNPNQPQYLVHCLFNKPPAKWQKCSCGEARYFAETGYPVFEIRQGKAFRQQLAPVRPQGSWNSAVERQFQEIVDEEQERVERHEHLAGEEIMEGDAEDNDVFDAPTGRSRAPSSVGSRSSADTPVPGFQGLNLASTGYRRGPSSGRQSFGSQAGSSPFLPHLPESGDRRSPVTSRPGTATSNPRTPSRVGSRNTSGQQDGRTSPTPQGRSPGSAPQGRGSDSAKSSPRGQRQGSPYTGKGKGPRRDGSGPGGAAAST